MFLLVLPNVFLTVTTNSLKYFVFLPNAIMIPEMNESHTLDLRMKKKKYDKLGIYRNGKLNEPSETLISEFTSLRTKDLDKDGEMELVGLQSVSGASTTDVIAKVQSIWTFKNKEFQLKRIMLIPS